MKKIDINEEIGFTFKELSKVRNDRLMLNAIIYERKNNELLKLKLKQFQEYLNNQICFYKLNKKNYDEIIDEYLHEYENKMRKIVYQYNLEYNYIQSELVISQTNQSIAIANLIISKRDKIKASSINNVALIEKADRRIFSTAQKKLNYDVVIDECEARLKKCVNDNISFINNVFIINSNQLDYANRGIFNKIKQFFITTFSGKKNFEKYVLKPLEMVFKNLDVKVISKVSDVKLETIAFYSQMNKIKNDINLAFNETLNKM